MKKKILGIIIDKESIESSSLRFAVEYAINYPDNPLSIGSGYHIDGVLEIAQLNQTILENIDILVDVWGYSFCDGDIEDVFNNVVKLDYINTDHCFAIVSLYEDDLEMNDFAFEVRRDAAYLSFVTTEQELEGGLDFVAVQLIQTFDLYDNNSRRKWFIDNIGLSNITYDDMCSYIISNSDQIEKSLEEDDKIKVTLSANPKLIKYLISLL